MDAQQFLAEFGHIANAPHGVQKLRELVLVLAMQGRLLPQATSESAISLLEAVSAEKKSLIATGALRSPKPFPVITTKDKLHVIPGNWCWARFGEIAVHNSGKTLDAVRNSGKLRDYITTSNLYWGRFDLRNVRKMPIRDEELEKCTARKGDLLICEGGEAGRAAVWTDDREVCFQNHVHRARFFGGINPFFVYRFFEKLNLTGEINAHRKGIGISNMSSKALAMITVPLPPLEEQSRIVAKVDELMALCDRLEQQQQDRRKLQNALRQSTLQALASAESPHELQESWQRLQANFGRLFSEPADVETLRASVLDLALVGHLSQRVPDDESVDAHLARTRDAKALRLASGEMKRKVGAATDVVQLDVDIPGHWSKATFEELFQFIDYRGKTPTKTESGVVLVTAKNVRPGRLDRGPVEYISESSYAEWMTRGFPKKGDLLFTTEAPLGNVALIEEPPTFALAQRVINLQPFADLNTRCAMYFMLSPRFQSLLDKNSSGMTAKGIKAAKLKQLEIPVPPVPEQARIVSRVEQLMRICDRFEKELRDGNKSAERLAIASTAQLTGVAIEQTEEAAVKAPPTELVAPLRLGSLPDVKDQAPLATLLARHNGEMSARDLWQRFGADIDAFYAQLKTEVSHGWITEPSVAEVHANTAEAGGG
ncbi:restriction endonuclease subunit S [Pseudoxanthomonas sp. X-1]|uniref:restriction endonuclease subunit S n=1 Tax=Pseudoxanthomonas sp. X-1 TaxID=2571115 RepID=UPI00110ABAF1|nr:restriction endonuclease subunit S [Pseudoxanthomonas sp. X-1]TMN25521.1 restriction endonuclease subunit S [Pseudoxanthomonas sp. X-1]UAY76274.1 restriction endonuclease subunit S [Pseudoxanthomonas sp. X-1]